MMKKKAIGLLLVLALALSLAACGGASPVEGTWEMEMDISEQVAQVAQGEMDALLGELSDMGIDMAAMPGFADYMQPMMLRYTARFMEDGTYSIALDKAAMEQELETYKVSLTDYYRALYLAILQESLRVQGLGELDQGGIEELMGMSLDEAIDYYLGMSMEDYVDQSVDSLLTVDDIAQDIDAEGKYETKDDRLYTSAGLEYDVDPDYYETFAIDGDTMTLEQGTMPDDESGLNVYPLTFKRVG